MVVQRAAHRRYTKALVASCFRTHLSSSDQISANISLHASYIHGMTHVEVESSHKLHAKLRAHALPGSRRAQLSLITRLVAHS
jgi:uncharacterized protein YpbB